MEGVGILTHSHLIRFPLGTSAQALPAEVANSEREDSTVDMHRSLGAWKIDGSPFGTTEHWPKGGNQTQTYRLWTSEQTLQEVQPCNKPKTHE